MQNARKPQLGSEHRTNDSNTLGAPVIVFSHLRWDFVTQRPQHILTRLAKTAKILFVEEPIPFQGDEEGTANLISISENITVLQPKIHAAHLIDDLKVLIQQHGAYLYPEAPILWFYSAAFHEISDHLPHALKVYDCMDELAAFKGASQLLVDQEKTLLQKADVVFTGGKSLYESKKQWSNSIYCYPSSVDRAHFEKALLESTSIPSDIKDIPQPIAGYFGVIDERIDYQLLAETAEQNPEISFVMIGPVVKVEQADLPRAPNLHYLGGKHYDQLPNYLKAFTVAMMPFALNESTRFISPTKTLEYIAAEKPVVSTAIHDVVRDYSHVIPIVHDATEFTAALKVLMQEDEKTKALRISRFKKILEENSWDKTVAAMQKNIEHTMSYSG